MEVYGIVKYVRGMIRTSIIVSTCRPGYIVNKVMGPITSVCNFATGECNLSYPKCMDFILTKRIELLLLQFDVCTHSYNVLPVPGIK